MAFFLRGNFKHANDMQLKLFSKVSEKWMHKFHVYQHNVSFVPNINRGGGDLHSEVDIMLKYGP